MKFVQYKNIQGADYYYFSYMLRAGGGRIPIQKYIGKALPQNFPAELQIFFEEVAEKSVQHVDAAAKKYFAPKKVLGIEQCHYWYRSLHHELLRSDLQLLQSLFATLFILNSNRAEGSRVTRGDIESLIKKKRKPTTLVEREVVNSLAAIRFAFSKDMKWNVKSLKKMHAILFDQISPDMAGKLKSHNVTISNEMTTDPKNVKRELHELFLWLAMHRRSLYPPIAALEFHWRFEAIHPFEDGNGRIGRLLFNVFLLQKGYMPAIFFSENHERYCDAISQARQGRRHKLAHYFVDQYQKTRSAILRYKKESIITGGSPQVGRWEIEGGRVRKF